MMKTQDNSFAHLRTGLAPEVLAKQLEEFWQTSPGKLLYPIGVAASTNEHL